ncbi:hypothetical protein DL93DRAFT_2161209 [Clavulina sp. PMI_390]|nr:hypothetical protein DL93DRAFT_2161209 [Clavulina sp. PMI_390]
MLTNNDFTTLLPSSSVKILVEDTVFQVPQSLLAYHSPEFGKALSSILGSVELPLAVSLETSPEVFREFYAILFTPLKSCLWDDYPVSDYLKTFVDIIAFLHKYKFMELERHLLSHPRLVEAALNALLHKNSPPKQGSSSGHAHDALPPDGQPNGMPSLKQVPSGFVSAYDILPIAERLRNTRLLGATYYNILLQGEDSWCGKEWELLSRHLSNPQLGDRSVVRHCCWSNAYSSTSLGEHYLFLTNEFLRLELPWFDILGKANLVSKLSSPNHSDPTLKKKRSSKVSKCTKELSNAMELLEELTYSFFIEEQEQDCTSERPITSPCEPLVQWMTIMQTLPPARIQHASMESRAMSLPLSIHDVDFLIPECLLEHHSETFFDMLNHSKKDGDAASILEDPLEAFRDLRSILFNPLDSCLFRPDLLTKNLKRALELLEVLNKYGFENYKDYVFQLLEPVLHAGKLEEQLSNEFTVFHVFHIGEITNWPLLKESARSVMLRGLWNRHPSLSPDYLLHFGEDTKDNELIGAAYYQIVLRGKSVWQEMEPGVTDVECHHLDDTRAHLAERWQKLFDSIGGGSTEASPLYHPCCWAEDCYPVPIAARLQALVRGLALSRTPHYDLMGKLQVLISIANEYCDKCSDSYASELAGVRYDLYQYYHPEDESELY